MTQDHSLYAHISPVAANVVHVVYNHSADAPGQSLLIADDFAPDAAGGAALYEVAADRVLFKNRHGEVVLQETGHEMAQKEIFRYRIDGEPILTHKSTANGEVVEISNARREPAGLAYAGRLTFAITPQERLYGLGQHENGLYDYNGNREYLYQTNMKISVPFLVSTRNYGLLIDTESALVFDARNGEMSFSLETVNELSYYVLFGESFDELIAALRTLTGRAVLLPRWAFGYLQSKERYRSAEELTSTAARFRALGIPVDCIIQDWYTWQKGLWGDKRADPARYPNLPALVESLHAYHTRLMVSVWPNMAAGGANYRDFEEKGLLLPNATVYNAFDEAARALYWQQCQEGWFSAGTDAFWCDNTEPFSDADWNGETKRAEDLRYRLIVTDSQKSMDWTRLNTYGLLHAKGLYENWRAQTNAKRVTNLTRSTYVSGQRYGVIAWSGDISAKWSVLKNQIVAGLQFAMSGAPYWTLDIGGFFTVKDKYENRGCEQAGNRTPLWFWDGDYNEGVNDLGYRELYVRWLQFAAFLPVFRSHGTDTPREPWNFGRPGEPFYDTIVAFIRLRYRLLPYIYSMAASVWREHDTLLRSLMFDFADDDAARAECHSYLFGRSLLVCPVTEPMYYGPNSAPLPDTRKSWRVYLPKPALWYDFWTNQAYAGGQAIDCDAPIQKMPLFVKAGAILPLSDPLTYADERNGETAILQVYAGADGAFLLYNDEGDGYAYETGNYSLIPVRYRDADKTLRLGKAEGRYPHQRRFAAQLMEDGQANPVVHFEYHGDEVVIGLA